jgi:c-di-GMP-binding flagellar brake protein YcgR
MNRSEQVKLAQMINQATSAKPEKRRHFRLSLHLPMEYSLPESSRFRLGYMADICEGGLLMYTTEKLDVGQNLKVKFYSASSAGMECIQAFGKVIRVDNLGKSEKDYRCGVRFSDMQPNFLEKLLKYLKNLY